MCLFTFLFLLLALDKAATRIFTMMFSGIEGGVMGSDRWRHQSFMLLFLWRTANDECIGRRSIQSQNSKLHCMYMHVTIFKLPQSR